MQWLVRSPHSKEALSLIPGFLHGVCMFYWDSGFLPQIRSTGYSKFPQGVNGSVKMVALLLTGALSSVLPCLALKISSVYWFQLPREWISGIENDWLTHIKICITAKPRTPTPTLRLKQCQRGTRFGSVNPPKQRRFNFLSQTKKK